MIEIFHNPRFDFIGKRKIAVAFSLFFFFGSILLTIFRGYNYNIDFTGGTELQYRFKTAMTEGGLREALDKAGISAEVTTLRGKNLSQPDWLLKIQGGETDVKGKVRDAIRAAFPAAGDSVLATTTIGARVGKELKRGATWATIWSAILLLIYVSVRFELMYAVGAVVATFHDVFFVLFFFSLFQIEFSLTVLAAILTLVGYSINDTIVVYDRIREQVKKQRGLPYAQVVNDAINQTLSRTILTVCTVLFAVIILLIFGGETLKTMGIALLIGVITGTYSSIFIAAPILIEWHDRRAAHAALSK